MKRYYYMDVLNILATFAVVVLHSSGLAFLNTGGYSWNLAVVIQILFIWAVPIFLMISGANILDYRRRNDTLSFFKKRMNRICIPFIFWTIAWFIYFNFEQYHYSMKSINTYMILFDGFVHNTIQPIFWYFYIIIGFYLSAPLLTKITNRENKRLTEYLLLINFVFVGIIGYFFQIKNQPDATINQWINIGTTGSIGYVTLGWYLKNFPLEKKLRKILYIVTAIFVLIMMILTFVFSVKRGVYQRNAYDVWGIGVICLSATVFTFIQTHFNNWLPSEKNQKLLRSLSSTSLGVYVIHYFFVHYAEVYLHSEASLWHILGLPVLVWLLSTIIVLIIKKIPYLRRIV